MYGVLPYLVKNPGLVYWVVCEYALFLSFKSPENRKHIISLILTQANKKCTAEYPEIITFINYYHYLEASQKSIKLFFGQEY